MIKNIRNIKEICVDNGDSWIIKKDDLDKFIDDFENGSIQAHYNRGYTKYNIDEVIAMYESGLSMYEIARRVGVKQPSIKQALVKEGVYVRNKNKVCVVYNGVEYEANVRENVIYFAVNGKKYRTDKYKLQYRNSYKWLDVIGFDMSKLEIRGI